jgi:peptidoglycan/LPS O-acetylase OafA/YrhL
MLALDLARIVAAYGVVWIHTPRSEALLHSRVLGRFAVPFFVAAAVLFVWETARRHADRSLSNYAFTRFTRLYLPFLAWSGIYLAFKLAKSLAAPELENDFPGWELFWVGGFYHLWFMPFLLAVSLIAFVAARAALGRPGVERFVGTVAAVGCGLLAVVPRPACVADHGSWAQLEWDALPTALFGLALAAFCGGRISRIGRALWMSTAGVVLASASLIYLWHDPSNLLAATLSGVGVLVAAITCPLVTIPRVVETLGSLSLGVYLSHLLFIKTLEAVSAKLHIEPTWQLDVTVFIAAVFASTGLSYGLSRMRATRWLVA